MIIGSETTLAAIAARMANSRRLTAKERALVRDRCVVSEEIVSTASARIANGEDVFGDAFLSLRSSIARRELGAVYTPAKIIETMITWAKSENAAPSLVVDPGCGSGSYLVAAAAAFPEARLLGIDIDPLAALMTRARAAVLGFADRLEVRVEDYRKTKLPKVAGATLFIGNPPYVRHHDIEPHWKAWYSATASRLGFKASQLAGLHLHFFLRTREIAQPGDYGAFITSSEWLDTNYGSTLRAMLADGLGGTSVHVIAAEAQPFAEAMTTGAITTFRVGNRPDVLHMRAVASAEDLLGLGSGQPVAWSDATPTARWSEFLQQHRSRRNDDMMELGELFRVHRGQVTGNNAAWIEGIHNAHLPRRFFYPTITKAKDLIKAGAVLSDVSVLRSLLDLPNDLDGLPAQEKKAVEQYLKVLRNLGVHDGYVAKNRRVWWSVNLKQAAPILCTYMARRAPAFVRNRVGARHINIAHGLYPKEQMTDALLDAIALWLGENVTVQGGRTYAGGLTKFEPREVERIRIPRLDRLHGLATETLEQRRADRRHRNGERRVPG
ncbi:N-6 DNA methylase [Bosea sp. SSUT16]|jgi:hypothetical protein|uniref:site-specific DNA-methyltransferase (adenine-specific) n=1 Tax=Bosea spartocytisi TaxID=2773451 RepID=A0A927E7E1_9HYPH|nr:N-6 DNA methylase [Bosea spartocytisi]MBD3846156.1 N-6 DNA methylase [Bosea spartocytisi]MCT4473340.1 N-6 DNA methylase [Bosea spartocytisi]